MLHFVTSYMKQNKSRKQTLESAQYGLEISFKAALKQRCVNVAAHKLVNPCHEWAISFGEVSQVK